MELKDLRVAMIPINSANGIDQNSDYNDIMKVIATRSDCQAIPLTDYFQMQNDDELPEHWSFLLDVENDVDLTGTNIKGVHQHEFHKDFDEGREIGDAKLQLKTCTKVIEKDGYIGTVYHVYDSTHVSLCLEGYDKIGNMVERDFQTTIDGIRLPKV